MYKEIMPIKLKQARIEAGYTQEQIAAIVKISKQTISKYETGKLEPSIETFGKLCDFYEVSADWVIGTKFSSKR